MRKIAVVTGSRADYSPLRSVIWALNCKPNCSFEVIRTQGLYGHEERITKALVEYKPDMLLLLGDRYETLVAASAAALLGIPICHIHGGEETEGAVDNGFRHAITKLAYYHFAIHADYADRIIQMGESPARVFVTGAPGVDQYADAKPIEAALKRPFALVCLHPETLGNDENNIAEVKRQLSKVCSYVVSSTNADPGNERITEFWKEYNAGDFVQDKESWIFLMQQADVLIGNSSSFILEGMALGKKVINIGDRQKGRYEEAIRHFAKNPFAYGKPGEVAPKIAELLLTLPIPEKPRKEFYDIAV
jgi:UDP-hydrolysing UDP-N-acetyl-D-glucosamine 2-epimerase